MTNDIASDSLDQPGNPNGSFGPEDIDAAVSAIVGGLSGLSLQDIIRLGNGQATQVTASNGTHGYFAMFGGYGLGAVAVYFTENGSGTYDSAAVSHFNVDASGALTGETKDIGDLGSLLDIGGIRAFNDDGSVYSRLNEDAGHVISATTPSWSELGDVSGQALARATLDILALKRDSLSASQGKIGAFLSRLSSASNVLHAIRENSLAAEGTIRDADLGTDSALLVQKQIQQQAAAAILAQVGIQPKIALSLLLS